MDQYKDVWATHLRNEMLVQNIRADNKLLVQKAFEELDYNKDGYIDREDVSYYKLIV